MAIDPKMAAKLKNFNKNFAKEKKRADELGGFAEIPDGKYLAKVASCDIKNSNAGEMHLVFQFEITESTEDDSLVGAKASKWCNIEKEDGSAYLIRDLRRFGIELEDLEQLPEVAKMIDDQKPEVKISLKTGNNGQFTYIDQVVSEMEAGDHAAAEDADEDVDDSDDDVEEAEIEEDESEEDEEEGTSVEVGMAVAFSWKGKDMEGVVKEVLDDKVKVSSGGKVYPLALEAISIPEAAEEEVEEEEEEEEEVVEVKAVAKKTAPKKAEPVKKAAPAKKTAAKKRK